ncbi:MAG: flagellar motor switch protein FliN [Armatimonadetes bacterium]|nr:flagellar motor switch protein FliN [Armatimonadota bacterium]
MADDDNQLLSNDDLDALFAGASGGGDEEEHKPGPLASAGEPVLLGGGGADDDIVDAMQLDQASIDALFSGGMPSSPPPAPKLTPRATAPEVKAPPATAARAGAAAPAAPGARPGKATQVGDLDLLAEVVLVLSAEIGRTDMSISDVLKLRPGSIVELDKLAGEPVELYVNDCCIARGEVVVVDDSFGIRVTELGDGQ